MTSAPHKIYLAGPDVFFPNPQDVARQKKQICEAYGFQGVFPLDGDIKVEPYECLSDTALKISQSNEGLMDQCDVLIANLTPFRGVSMDCGTAFEVGYMRAKGKPVFGYTNVVADYHTRVQRYYKSAKPTDLNPDYEGATEIENFGFAENLMIEGAIIDCSKEEVVRQQVVPGEEFKCLKAFEECVDLAQKIFNARA